MASIFEAALLFGIVVRPAICIPHALYMAAGLPARDINTSMAHNFRGDGSRNGLQLLQTKSGTKRRQAVTFRSAELDLASQVGLSQEGYASVLSMHNEEQTVTFVRRVIAKFNATVTDDGSLAGIIPFYTGKFDNTPTFSDLTRELATATWLTGFRGASTASLDEEGYHSVADMLNDDQMRAYIRRVIAAHGGREAAGRLSIPGKFVCADCPRLFGMARRYSGTESRQSYKALVSELRSTDWLEGVNESQVAKLEHDPARMRLASTRCDDCEESLLYIGVFSAPYNWKRRDDVRRSWMQDGIFGGPKPRVKAKFIIGRTDNHSLNFDIEEESRMYGDIQRLPVEDAYHNLPNKSIAFFRWFARKYCCSPVLPKFWYAMKLDDDTWPNMQTLLPLLNKHRESPSTLNYVGGFLWNGPVQREGKWAETIDESAFGLHHYPAYAAGSGYVLSLDLARRLDETVEKEGILILRNEDTTIGNWIKRENHMRMSVNYYEVNYTQYGCQDGAMIAMNLCTGALRCMWEKRLLGLVPAENKSVDMCCTNPWMYGMPRVSCGGHSDSDI